MISVILPGYERADAVLCALAALAAQTYQDFEVVLVDDSDTSAVQDAVVDAPSNVHYMRSSPPRTGNFTAGRARNIGAANAQGQLLVFIDQDVMLAPDALAHYARAYERHGDNVVILGIFHWLPPLDFTPADVRESFLDIYASAFGELQRFPYLPFTADRGMLGLDIRQADFTDDVDAVVEDAALGAWSANVGYPRNLFIALGGFDEAINRHGGEDADLGLTAREYGARFLQYARIWGLHRWHPRNQAQNEKDVQANIDYIDRKHGIGRYAQAKKTMDARNWSDPRHYHREVGGVLMQANNGDPTVWVCREGHRLGLSKPTALKRLGFTGQEVLLIPPSSLAAYEVMGTVE